MGLMQLSRRYLDILLLVGRKDTCVSWCLVSIIRPAEGESRVVMRWSRKQMQVRGQDIRMLRTGTGGCRGLGAGEHLDRCGGVCPGLEGREGGFCLRSVVTLHSMWWVASFVS